MADPYTLEGWKGVASALNRSVPSAKRYAARATDPLPVATRLGRVVARPDLVAAWAARWIRPRGAERARSGDARADGRAELQARSSARTR